MSGILRSEKFGTFLRKCRMNKDLSQEELAERLGVPRSAISKIEKGKQEPNFFVVLDWINNTNAREMFIAYLYGVDLAAVASAIGQLLGGG